MPAVQQERGRQAVSYIREVGVGGCVGRRGGGGGDGYKCVCLEHLSAKVVSCLVVSVAVVDHLWLKPGALGLIPTTAGYSFPLFCL